MPPFSLTARFALPITHISSLRKWSLKDMAMHEVTRPLGTLCSIIHPASWTTMSTIPMVHRTSLRKCSLKEQELDVFRSSSKIILGSSSVARQRILSEMGYEFSIMTADIDEKSIRKDKPEELVMSLAHAKADAIIAKLQKMGQPEEDAQATLLITADTVVVYKGVVREKPTSREEAWNFIKGYSDDNAAVVGSVLVTNLKTGTRKGTWERAEVYFHEIPDNVINSLIEEGVSFNVAGGLMLEHPLILPLVENVVGRTDTVMGLSKDLTEKLIAEAL